jgi:hypothetical protein
MGGRGPFSPWPSPAEFWDVSRIHGTRVVPTTSGPRGDSRRIVSRACKANCRCWETGDHGADCTAASAHGRTAISAPRSNPARAARFQRSGRPDWPALVARIAHGARQSPMHHNPRGFAGTAALSSFAIIATIGTASSDLNEAIHLTGNPPVMDSRPKTDNRADYGAVLR